MPELIQTKKRITRNTQARGAKRIDDAYDVNNTIKEKNVAEKKKLESFIRANTDALEGITDNNKSQPSIEQVHIRGTLQNNVRSNRRGHTIVTLWNPYKLQNRIRNRITKTIDNSHIATCDNTTAPASDDFDAFILQK